MSASALTSAAIPSRRRGWSSTERTICDPRVQPGAGQGARGRRPCPAKKPGRRLPSPVNRIAGQSVLAAERGAVQGDLGRNALRGFGATEVDLTLRRQLKLRERLSLQARADLFNIFNQSNFGPPTNYLSSPLSGPIDADAGSVARKRRPEWRHQSAISNRRTALGATGPEAPVLRICPPDISDR